MRGKLEAGARDEHEAQQLQSLALPICTLQPLPAERKMRSGEKRSICCSASSTACRKSCRPLPAVRGKLTTRPSFGALPPPLVTPSVPLQAPLIAVLLLLMACGASLGWTDDSPPVTG